VPGINSAVIGEEALQFTLDTDKRDRDGIYLGYNLPHPAHRRAGQAEPAAPVHAAARNPGPHRELHRTRGRIPRRTAGEPETCRAGDLFGLTGVLDLPIDRFRLQADTSLSTFSPDNLAAGTRSIVRLSTPLGLGGHSTSQGQLFGTYRERVYNGSLGLQTVVYSYGGQLEGSLRFNPDPSRSRRAMAGARPMWARWNSTGGRVAGTYQASLFERNQLDTQWRRPLERRL
jgi:hypothetical protein